MNFLIVLLLLAALSGGAGFWMGCLYFSVKSKKPHMYGQMKILAENGNRAARRLLLALYMAIFSAVLLGVFTVYAAIKNEVPQSSSPVPGTSTGAGQNSH